MCRYIVCFLAIPVQFVVATGWNDYNIKVRRGYRLVRTNADSIMIYRQDYRFVVPPKIVGLNVHGDIIFGKVESSPDADLPSVPGFFVLNTKKSQSVRIGLDKHTWLSLLKGYGISEEPALKKPSRFFMIKIHISRSLKFLAVFVPIATMTLIICHIWQKRHKMRGDNSAQIGDRTIVGRA